MSATPLNKFIIVGTRIDRYIGTGITHVVIPAGITEIGNGVFSPLGDSGAKEIESLVIPNSVKKIGKLAFFRAINLRTVTIPESVHTIGSYVFNSCPNLTIRTTLGSCAQKYALKNNIHLTLVTKAEMATELAAAQSNAMPRPTPPAPNPAPRPVPPEPKPTPKPMPPKPTPSVEPKRAEVKKNRKFYLFTYLGDMSYYYLNSSLSGMFSGNHYWDHKYNDIVLRPATKREEAKILKVPRCLYAYEEDDVFYEFFTGKLIGRRRKHTVNRDNRAIRYDIVERNGYILTAFKDFGVWTVHYHTIASLPAEKFRDEVQKYLPYRSHVTSEMDRLLCSIDKQYERLSAVANAKKEYANRKKQEDESWLDDFINNR